MPRSEVKRPQLLERIAAEVGQDLVAGDVAVALPGGASQMGGAVEPLPDELTDRHRRRVDGGAVNLLGDQASKFGASFLAGTVEGDKFGMTLARLGVAITFKFQPESIGATGDDAAGCHVSHRSAPPSA